MKLTNNKGITLVALIITIIVMLIIAGIAMYSGSGVVEEAKIQDVKTNMLLVQATVKNYVEQAKFEKKDTIDGVTIDGVALSVTASPDINGFYKINDMNALNLGTLSAEDYLISFDINQVLVEVYFVPGITDSSGKTFHKLSEMQE